MDNYGNVYYAIFHSTNNGETISWKYESLENTPSGQMQVGKVLGDATPGALYNIGNNELWVSFDYGESWVYRENYSYAKYAAGYDYGEIFRRSDYNFMSVTITGEILRLLLNHYQNLYLM